MKIENLIRRKKIYSDPVFDNKYLRTKIKSYNSRFTRLMKRCQD